MLLLFAAKLFLSRKDTSRAMTHILCAVFKFSLLSLAATGFAADPPSPSTTIANTTATKLDSRIGSTDPRRATIEIAAFSPLNYERRSAHAIDYGNSPTSYTTYSSDDHNDLPDVDEASSQHNYHKSVTYETSHHSELAQRLHDYCHRDRDCRNIPYSACRARKCHCTEALFVESLTGLACLHRSRLGVHCEQNNQCDSLVENSLCAAGYCRCAGGFVPFGALECVPVAKWIHEPCIVQDQCAGLGIGAICYGGRCECDPVVFVASNGPLSNTLGGPFSVYTSGWSPGQLAGAPSVCLYKRKLGEPCLTVEQCAFRVWNSTCNNGICTCVPNAVPIGNEQCAAVSPVLGSPCTVDLQCLSISPDAVCSQGICQCSSDTVQQTASATTCLLADAALNDPCVETAQCAANNSVCINNVCTCDNGFSQLDVADVCLADAPSIGDPCTVSSQCDVPNTFCDPVTSTCVCANNFASDAIGLNCIPGGAAIGAPCTVNAQCTRGPLPTLSAGGVLPICIAGRCACPTGTVADMLLNICLPMCLTVGGPCISTVQCQYINKYNVFICAYDPVVSGMVCTIVP